MTVHNNELMPCSLCHRVAAPSIADSKQVIAEFEHSFLFLGDIQLFPGHCILVLKEHVRELHDLSDVVQKRYFEELVQAGKAVHSAFKPWKLNYSCYGNLVPHLHWHIFPRYEDDPNKLLPVWTQMDRFDTISITDDEVKLRVALVRSCLSIA